MMIDSSDFAMRMGFEFAHESSVVEMKETRECKNLSEANKQVALDAYWDERNRLINLK